MKILIVEDNLILSNNIKISWDKNIDSKQNFDGKNISFELNNDNYDSIIMDLWLWEVDWIDVCQNLRKSWKIFLFWF